MKAYRFIFPKPVNGQPDMFDVKAPDVRTAVKAVFKETDRDALGATVFMGQRRRKLGVLRLGPTLHAGRRPVLVHQRRVMDVLPSHFAHYSISDGPYRDVKGNGNVKT